MSYLALLDFVSAWWSELDLARQLFFGIGLLAGFMTLLLALLAILGMEHHDGVDALSVTDFDHGGGGIFSIKPLTGFFLAFGWSGAIAMDFGWGFPLAMVCALSSGVAVMAGVVLLFRALYSLRSDGTAQIAQALHATGSVYITVPPTPAGGGQVIISFSGRQETLPALNATPRALQAGEAVRVVKIITPRTVVVEPLSLTADPKT